MDPAPDDNTPLDSVITAESEMWFHTLNAVQRALFTSTAEDVHYAQNLLRAARAVAGI